MEHRYTQTLIGKIHAAIVAPTLPLIIIAFYLAYIEGKEANLWGILVSLIGFTMFFKAKLSVIKHKKLFSVGCDLMDQKNVYFYFFGWVVMIGGYFLSWT